LRWTFWSAELLDAIANPKHERHAELTEWIGDDFDPEADNAQALIAAVAVSQNHGRGNRHESIPNSPSRGLHRVITNSLTTRVAQVVDIACTPAVPHYLLST
jgi:hypothetical protein